MIFDVIDFDPVIKDRIYKPGKNFITADRKDLVKVLERSVNPLASILFFVDNISHCFRLGEVNRLDDTLEVLQRCEKTYIFATAQIDQLTNENWNWLNKNEFHHLHLNGLLPEQVHDLVNDVSEIFKLKVDDEACTVFAENNDGTPKKVIDELCLLEAKGIKQIDRSVAQDISEKSFRALRKKISDYILNEKREAGPLIKALTDFHSSGVIAYVNLTLQYAVSLWRMCDRWGRPWLRKKALHQALNYLTKFDVVVSEGQIHSENFMVDLEIDRSLAQRKLGTFLTSHRKVFQNQFLRNLYPDAKSHAWALFDLAFGVQSNGEFSLAAKYYSLAVLLNPHPYYFNNRGTAYYKQGDWGRAIADFSEAVELDPKYFQAFYNRGNAYAKEGNWERAITDYTRAVELDSENAQAFYNRGAAYYKQGDWGRAIADFSEAVELDPRYARAFFSRGTAYANQGDWDPAIADYTRSIELDSENAQAFYNRGAAYYYKEDLEQAITDFSRAIKLDSQYVKAFRSRALCFIVIGDLEKAKMDCRSAEELDQNHPYTQARWGDLAYARCEYTTSLEYYAKAASLVSDPTEFNLDIALPLLCLGRSEEALSAITERFTYNLDKNEVSEKLRDYKKLKELQPGLPGIDQAITMLQQILT